MINIIINIIKQNVVSFGEETFSFNIIYANSLNMVQLFKKTRPLTTLDGDTVWLITIE